MLHSVYDLNPARLNGIMPTLQRMEEDPEFLEDRRQRFDQDDPPPPYSSHSTTRLPTPDPFPPAADGIDIDELLRKPLSDFEINVIQGRVEQYYPRDRYDAEVLQEKDRIWREWARRDENYIPLYGGPDIVGRPGQQRLHIMIRHSIKRRWQLLRVWNPEWGVPTDELGGFGNDNGPNYWVWDQKSPGIKRKYDYLRHEEKMASWPSRDEETPDERAIRLYLEREGRWSETLKLQSSGAGDPHDIDVDDRESLVTSRPWFVWGLEVAEEEVRLRRNPQSSWIRDPAAADNVRARWKEKGHWKESWPDLPGWKWRHESPSPEPADPNDIEFTPSEIDALEAIPPPTPPTPVPPPRSKPSSLDGQPLSSSDHVRLLFRQSINAASPASTQLTSKSHTDDYGDHEGNRSAATAELSRELARRLSENNADMAPWAEQRELFSTTSRRRSEVFGNRNRYGQQRQSTNRRLLTRSDTRATSSTARLEIPSPVSRKTRRGQKASPAPSKSSKITKPITPRRSPRIAERERRAKCNTVPSEAAKAMNKDDVTPQSQISKQVKETIAGTTRTKKGHLKEGHPPTSSKPQGVVKRRGRSRRLTT